MNFAMAEVLSLSLKFCNASAKKRMRGDQTVQALRTTQFLKCKASVVICE